MAEEDGREERWKPNGRKLSDEEEERRNNSGRWGGETGVGGRFFKILETLNCMNAEGKSSARGRV